MPRATPEEAATALLECCNGFSDQELKKALVEKLRREHRTIQGYALRTMIQVLQDVGNDPNWGTDARNEAPVKFCRALAKSKSKPLRAGLVVC